MIPYIIKSSLSMLLMFGIYWFLLRREKLFRFNRFYLIFSIAFSLIIPVISIPVKLSENGPKSELITVLSSTLETMSPENENVSIESIQPHGDSSAFNTENRHTGINLSLVLLIIYFSGVLIFLIRFMLNIFLIRNQIVSSEKLSSSGYTIALTSKHVNPYSFFGTIVLNKDDFRNDHISSDLLRHEIEHIRQCHSYDIVIVELIRIIYWFNPILLLYNSAIRINHEYLADYGTLNESCDINSYAENLIGFICHQKNVRLTSGFNPSLTRKRLLMMTRQKPGKGHEILRIVLTACTVLIILFLISGMKSASQPSGQLKDIDGNVYKTVKIGTQVWMAENLKTTRYNDGAEIPLVTDSALWQAYKPAFCWYKNEESPYKEKYGALYNWYAVNTNKLCPAGWHVPDMIEFWYILPDYLENNGYGFGASKKEIAKALASASGWKSDTNKYYVGTDQLNNNKSGFSAIPSGYRSYSGEFGPEGEYASWWSSQDYNEYIGRGFALIDYYTRLQPYWRSKRSGFSIRCVKDLTDSRDFANFTGEWILNLQKSSDATNLVAQTLFIAQKDNIIKLRQKVVLPNPAFGRGESIYVLDGKESTDKIDSSAIVSTSAKWSPGKQSFTITQHWISSYKGKKFESVNSETYFMLENGKSLIIYSNPSFIGGRYVPPEKTEKIAYYDRK